MDTYLDMVTELQNRLMVSDNSNVFGLARCRDLIKNGHMWATSRFNFRELTKPKYTTTQADFLYDYPDEYRTDSISAIYINNELYKKKILKDFNEYKRVYPTSTKRIFADVGRQYLIFPTPIAGLILDVYGQVQATQFVNDTDRSIFSLSNVDGNEAIVLHAESVAKKDPTKKTEAYEILGVIYAEQKNEAQYEQSLQPMFNVPDMFAGNGVNSLINPQWGTTDPDDDI